METTKKYPLENTIDIKGYIILANDYGDLLKRTKAMYSDDYVVFYLEQQKGGLDVN